MSLVNDLGRPASQPNSLPSPSNPTGSATLADYRSWRRVAVAVRASVQKVRPEGALSFLTAWAGDASPFEVATLNAKADPKLDDARFPKVPMGAGTILAMGGADVFTGKLDGLVSYARRGNDLVPEGEGTFALEQARKRDVKVPSTGKGFRTFLWGIATTVVGGLTVYGVTRGIEASRRRGRD